MVLFSPNCHVTHQRYDILFKKQARILANETPETLARLLSSCWEVVAVNTGLSAKAIAEQAIIAPARCCLKNIGQVGASDDTVAREIRRSSKLTVEERLVETAFTYLRTLSEILKHKFDL